MKRIGQVLVLLGVFFARCLFAVEIGGKVSEITADSATIITDSDLEPSAGDKVEIFFKIPGTDDEVLVGTARVSEVGRDSIRAKIEKASGTVEKGQLARITSPNPRQKVTTPSSETPVSASQPSATSTPGPPPATDIPKPSAAAPPNGAFVLAFDQFEGRLPGEAFAADGVRILGEATVAEAGPEMVLPFGLHRVLMVSGGRQTTVTLVFDPPLSRFSLTRIGATKGASVPTWKVEALDRRGQVLASAGETHGLYEQPRKLSVEGSNIGRVRLSSDNRFGNGTWATYNSLPVAEFEAERMPSGGAAASEQYPAAPAPQSGDLSRRLVGQWQGGRHRTQYLEDGTFVIDPYLPYAKPLGRWRVEARALIESFFAGNSLSWIIVALSETELVLKDQEGRVFHLKRFVE
jgi:hypothetical protein